MKTLLAVIILFLFNTQLYSQSKKSLIKNFNQYFEITCNECSFTVDNNLMAEINCNDSQYVFSLCDAKMLSTLGNTIENIKFILKDSTVLPVLCIPVSNPLENINSEDDILFQFAKLRKYCDNQTLIFYIEIEFHKHI